MRYLPPEVIYEILLRLPAKDLIRFSSVSKLWNGFIRSKDFIKEHQQRAIDSNDDGTFMRFYFDKFYSNSAAFSEGRLKSLNAEQQIQHPFYSIEDKKRLRLYSSMDCVCNGLILLQVNLSDNFRHRCLGLFLWNPTIARHIKIKPLDATENNYRIHGVCYHSNEDDLKVFTLKELGVNSSELHVYSLASGTWKRVEKLPPKLYLPGQMGMVSLKNSCVAWLMKDMDDRTSTLVVTFDLDKEDYHALPLPVEAGFGKLMVLGGSLAIWHTVMDNRYSCTNVWFMKDSNSWFMELSTTRCCEPLFFDGERFLCLDDHDNTLFWYTIKTRDH